MLASAVMIASAAGCSVSPGQAPSTQAPLVAECGVFNISTPTRYACNGKVYTAYQLAKLRAEEEKKYASSK